MDNGRTGGSGDGRNGGGAASGTWRDVLFTVSATAVSAVLARTSTRHGGLPCPRAASAVAAGLLADCDRGCFDEAVDLLATVVEALERNKQPATGASMPSARPAAERMAGTCMYPPGLRTYASRVATTAVGQRNRDRRKRLGIPQRPERIPSADWAVRALPDARDRQLLQHMITWLASDSRAVGQAGWPLLSWAARYGVNDSEMAAWVSRILAAMRVADPDRYRRYLAGPLAAKPHQEVPFSAAGEQCSVGRALWGRPAPSHAGPVLPGTRDPSNGQPSNEQTSNGEEEQCAA